MLLNEYILFKVVYIFHRVKYKLSYLISWGVNCPFTENFLARKLDEKVCILRSVYLSVHFRSCCFYIHCHGGIREITYMPLLYYVDSTSIDSFILRSYLQYKKGPDLNLPPLPPPFPVHYL